MPNSDPTTPQSGGPAPQGGDQPTLLTPAGASKSAAPASTPGSYGSTPLPTFSASQLSIAVQDLSGDALIASAPRMVFDNKPVPSLGGIPLLAKLGQGGMGAVYFGVKVMLRQEVAVKVLPLHLAQQQPDLIARFVREAQIAARIESPHLVHVTDVAESAGLFYIIMEFVSGQSAGGCLKKLIQSGQRGMDEATALDACIAATNGLAAAHTQGVIHRDVKPDNILVPLEPRSKNLLFASAKIADLGLARADDMGGASLTGAQSAMGTPGFMAPEQALNARTAGKPADVFSMGATLYALLAGKAPFKGETITEAIIATIQKQHAPITDERPDVSAATRELIERCLMKDPAKRYVDASALLEALKVCRAALSASPERQSEALNTLVSLQKAPEVGQAVRTTTPPPTAASTVVGAPPPTLAATGSSPSVASASPAPAGGRNWIFAAGAALILAGVAWFVAGHGGKPGEGAAAAPVGAVELGIACGYEKTEWVKWAIAQFESSPSGKGVKVNLIAMSPAETESAILESDKRINISAPASSFFHEAFVTEWQKKYGDKPDPIERTENVALTPLVYLMFEDRYQAFIATYKELTISTLNDAMRAKSWEKIAHKPEWGRFLLTCSNPAEFNNGLTALTLMAYHFNKKDHGLTVADVESKEFQEWGRVFAPALKADDPPSALMKQMVLRGASAFDLIFTYESAVIANIKNFEGRWGGVRIIYPKLNVWNDNPFYILNVPWSSDDQKKAANKFIDFLLTEPIQRELPKYGFRTGNPNVPILFPGSPFETYKNIGLSVNVPVTIDVPPQEVLEALQTSAANWVEGK